MLRSPRNRRRIALVLRRLFAVEHDIIEHFQGVEKRLIHVKVLVRRETSDEDDARFLGRHLAIPFVQFAIRRIGHRVIRFAVIARVLLEDDRARLLARPTRLIGFMFILDDARVFHLGTGVIQLQTRLIKPARRRGVVLLDEACLLYTSPSPRDA